MILHLITDEKVVSRMIKLFDENNSNNNLYLCFLSKNSKGLKYLKQQENILIKGSFSEPKLPWNNIDKIVIHSLTPSMIMFINKHYRADLKIIWCVWGADIYNSYLRYKGFKLYADNSNAYRFEERGEDSNNILNHIRYKFHYIVRPLKILKRQYSLWLQKKFMETKVNYLVSSNAEVELFNKYINFKALKDNLNFSYYSIEDVLGSLSDSHSCGCNIMIGNSGSFTNNHEYVLQFLKKLDLSKYKVTVPLSYAGTSDYRNFIMSKYKQEISANVLTDFLPLEEYNKLMTNTSVYIFGNFRQEAWGNILIALYLGGKVYLSSRSPLVKHCKGLGFKVFELEDIEKTFQICLSETEKERNRKICLSHYSSKKNEENIKKICSL